MKCDVAVGMSQDQLNAAAAAVHEALYPRVFTGTHEAEYSGTTFTVHIDVQQPPQFDLSSSQPVEDVQRALSERMADTAAGGGLAAVDRAEIAAVVADACPSFAMQLPAVALSLSNGTTTKLQLALTAQCYIESGPTTISFVPFAVSAAPQPDPVTDYLVQHVVLPAVKQMLTQLLSGVQIPPIEVAGVPLSAPSVGLVAGRVVVATNVMDAGTPPPPQDGFPVPATPFFALLGPGLVQRLSEIAASSASNRFSDSDRGGDFAAGYEWSYGLSLTKPRAAIRGSGAELAFSLSGRVKAGVHVTILNVDVGFDAHAVPDPTTDARFSIEGDQLVLTAQSVHPFTIFVTPNTVPTWVFGWLITAIVNGVTATLSPLVTTFLKDIRLSSYRVPTYSISVEGTTLSLKPEGLRVDAVDGAIALMGSAKIIHG